jgi:biotin operon repressor
LDDSHCRKETTGIQGGEGQPCCQTKHYYAQTHSPEGSSLTNLAAKTGLSRDAVQKDYEIFLQKLGFMEITSGKGRTITSKGLTYLKQLDDPNFLLTPCEMVVL